MWINKEMCETFLEDTDWDIAAIMLEFLKVFYLAIAVFSNVYCPSSHIVLYNIYEITVCSFKYCNHTLLGPIVTKIEAKFLKY